MCMTVRAPKQHRGAAGASTGASVEANAEVEAGVEAKIKANAEVQYVISAKAEELGEADPNSDSARRVFARKFF